MSSDKVYAAANHVLSTPDEQLLFAAKTDASEIVETVFTTLPPDEYDVNHQDGLGNTGTWHIIPPRASRLSEN